MPWWTALAWAVLALRKGHPRAAARARGRRCCRSPGVGSNLNDMVGYMSKRRHRAGPRKGRQAAVHVDAARARQGFCVERSERNAAVPPRLNGRSLQQLHPACLCWRLPGPCAAGSGVWSMCMQVLQLRAARLPQGAGASREPTAQSQLRLLQWNAAASRGKLRGLVPHDRVGARESGTKSWGFLSSNL